MTSTNVTTDGQVISLGLCFEIRYGPGECDLQPWSYRTRLERPEGGRHGYGPSLRSLDSLLRSPEAQHRASRALHTITVIRISQEGRHAV